MDFIDRLRTLGSRAESIAGHAQSEEATKTALVLPFIGALGYDVFDPTEVVPEYHADVGQRKGEKVDYAIIKDGAPILLIECKPSDSELSQENATQLYRYFTATEARFGILTNGLLYRFYSDLDEPNRMDGSPFMEFSLLEDVTERAAKSLKIFTKSAFDLESSIHVATNVKYITSIKQVLADQLKRPSNDFVLFILSQVYKGTRTKKVRESFVGIAQDAFREFINDRVQKRLKLALDSESEDSNEVEVVPDEAVGSEQESDIVTTEDEIMGYHVVKSVLLGHVDLDRVVMMDRVTYCNILLDNDPRRAICRFYFGSKKKAVAIQSGAASWEKIPIDSINDIYNLQDKLRDRVSWLLAQA